MIVRNAAFEKIQECEDKEQRIPRYGDVKFIPSLRRGSYQLPRCVLATKATQHARYDRCLFISSRGSSSPFVLVVVIFKRPHQRQNMRQMEYVFVKVREEIVSQDTKVEGETDDYIPIQFQALKSML